MIRRDHGFIIGAAVCAVGLLVAVPTYAVPAINTPTADPDGHLDIEGTHGIHRPHTSEIVFRQFVRGTGGGLVPDGTTDPGGDGATILGYVFPTTLTPSDVGFEGATGIVALALTAHPDFDDTPLFDENNDGDFANDGGLYHSHWVVLVADTNVHDSFFVEQFDVDQNGDPVDPSVMLPATHPGLPMFIDSPNFFVEQNGSSISVRVPVAGVNGQTTFNFDAVTAYMEVHNDGAPLLGVYAVYDVFSGDLSLPFQVQTVPEPVTAALSLMSLGVLGMATRRRMA